MHTEKNEILVKCVCMCVRVKLCAYVCAFVSYGFVVFWLSPVKLGD